MALGKGVRLFLLTLVFVAAVAGIGAAYSWQQVQRHLDSPLNLTQPAEYKVEPGQSVRSILTQWQQQGWAPSAKWLRLGLKVRPQLAAIKAGTYELTQGITAAQALALIVSGEEKQFYITLIEGETAAQWLAKLHQHKKVSAQFADIHEVEQALDIDNGEGWFLPETYAFTAGTSDKALLLRSHRAMKTALDDIWQQRQSKLPLKNAYELLILASIIEKETGAADERPLVSSVFVNRLNKRMRLQTDPTVIYGLGASYQGRLTRKALRTATPYNTYKIKGLPPTPIANPSLASLQAAARPKTSDFVYFVAKGDGTHHFSRSLREHNNAVNKYIRKR